LPIRGEHVNFAGMFSNQTGMGFDNSSLVSKLGREDWAGLRFGLHESRQEPLKTEELAG